MTVKINYNRVKLLSKIDMEFKQEGFKEQRSLVLPDAIREILKTNKITSSCYVTDIGYYPKARMHYRSRESGAIENILIYCTDGSGWIEVGGKKYVVSVNQFFVIPSGVSHRYAADKQDPWSIYWLHFNGTMTNIVEPLFNRVGDITLVGESRIKERLDIFEDIFQNLQMGYSSDNLEYVSIAALHLLASFRYISQFREIKKVKNNNIIQDSILYMKDNLDKQLLLDEIANHVGYSASHFSLLFREKTTYSPLEYFNQLKMQYASQYLELTDICVKELAFKLGFSDPLYFSKVFKRYVGKSPLQFRSSCRFR